MHDGSGGWLYLPCGLWDRMDLSGAGEIPGQHLVDLCHCCSCMFLYGVSGSDKRENAFGRIFRGFRCRAGCSRNGDRTGTSERRRYRTDGVESVWKNIRTDRKGRKSEADVDLGQGPYAGMVDPEHAVMNYSSGSWYVEDLGSRNGLSVKKSADGKVYRLSSDTPCRLEKGDCLRVGMNRLLLR